jgi:hypothetical protein
MEKRAGKVVQVVEHLPSKWSSNNSNAKGRKKPKKQKTTASTSVMKK